MPKTDRIMKIASLLLFLALAVYIGGYLVSSISNPLQTSSAIMTTILESGRSEGIIIRSEQLIKSSLPNIYISATDGEKVALGATLALSHANENGLNRANRVRELRLEIARVEALLSGSGSGDLSARERSVSNALFSLNSAIARRETQNLDSLALNLHSLAMGGSDEPVTQENLDELKTELNSTLRTTLTSGDTTAITAPLSGIYSSILDGYETLSPESLDGLSPSSLTALMSAPGGTPGDAIGKLITSQKWYYAAKMTSVDAERLKVGDFVEVDFGRHYDKLLSLKVLRVSAAENEERVVLFSSIEALSDTLALRFVTAEIKFAEYSGLRVPNEALRVDEDGANFVYVLEAMTANKKPVEIIYADNNYSIATLDPAPEGLREGNEIIVRARGLFDGKVLN